MLLKESISPFKPSIALSSVTRYFPVFVEIPTGLMVTAVTLLSNDPRSANVIVPGPATSVRSMAALVSTSAPNITVISSTLEASSSAVAGSTMSQQTKASTTSQVVSSATSSDPTNSSGNSPSTGVQQPSSPTLTPTPHRHRTDGGQPSISTIQSTTVVTEATTATTTSTLIPVSTFSKPVVVTEVAQNGSTSVFTPSFVTVLTTGTNLDGSVTTLTGVYANPTSDSSSRHETFFQNTAAVAGVFSVLGIILTLVILFAVYLMRRSRRKRRQSGWQSPAASSDRHGSPTMRSISSETPSALNRSSLVLPAQDNSLGYLPVHVDMVQETVYYPERGPSVEAPTHRPNMVSLTHNRLSNYSPRVPVQSEPVQGPHRWPPEGPFTDAAIPNPKRISLMRDHGLTYLPKILIPTEARQVPQRQGEILVSPTKMAFPTLYHANKKRPSILGPAETVRESQQSATDVRNVDSSKWKSTTSPPTQRGNTKAVEEPLSSSQSSPSIYPCSLPPVDSEDESTTVGEQPPTPTVPVKKQAATIPRPQNAGAPTCPTILRPHSAGAPSSSTTPRPRSAGTSQNQTILRPRSAGAPPRPPRSVLRSGAPPYHPLELSTPSSSSSTTADSPPAISPRRTLLDVRPRSAGTPSRSMYQ